MEVELPFNLLFEQATLAIVVVDNAGIIVSLNPFAQKMFGYTTAAIIGKKIEVLIPHEYRNAHIGHRTTYEKSPKNRAIGKNMVLYALRNDGSVFPAEICISKAKEAELTIAFIIDITSRIENEKFIEQKLDAANAIQKLNDELEQKIVERTLMLKETLSQLEHSNKELEAALSNEKELSDLKSRFVSMASHEFKTPLSTILSSVSLIEKYAQSGDKDKQQKHIERIKSSVKNLSGVLDEFLSVGRLDEGKIHINNTNIHLPQLIEDILSEMQFLKKPRQNIMYECKEEITLFTDEYLLRNAIVNVIVNSLKYSGNEATIHIEVKKLSDKIQISITDNGIGINAQDLKHITELFFRGKNAVNIQGTGLGLNIVVRYMTELGGSFSIESQENKGTTVRLELLSM